MEEGSSDGNQGTQMSSVSLPVTRPTGRALLVGGIDCRQRPLALLQDIGFICVEADDPYSAMVELSRRPQAYRAMVLSLQSVYREELSLIATVKGRFPQVEIWLTDTDGRQASLADAMRHGADGLLGNDGLHRVAMAVKAENETPARAAGSKRHGRSGRSRRSRSNHAPAEPADAPKGPPPFLAASPPAPAPLSKSAAAIAASGQKAPAPAHPPRQERPTNGDAATGAPKRSRPDIYDDLDPSGGDAVLTAEELRALLHEQPANEDNRK
jgi:hypothetical protein